eukprot:6022706-Pyramimonas_sp.AAC.1
MIAKPRPDHWQPPDYMRRGAGGASDPEASSILGQECCRFMGAVGEVPWGNVRHPAPGPTSGVRMWDRAQRAT